ncbi:MAG: hypothetical protein WA876_11235 [Candidatus Acidiferrales bacterium]
MKYLVALGLFMVTARPIQNLNPQHSPEMMTLEGQPFEIGMPKEKALAELSACCTLAAAAPEPDSWTVETKRPPFEILGFIWFAKGRVSKVEQERGQFKQDEAVALAQSLFRLVSEVSRSRSETTVTQIDTTEGSNLTIRTVTFRFDNGRSIILAINKVDRVAADMSDWVQITETLEKP